MKPNIKEEVEILTLQTPLDFATTAEGDTLVDLRPYCGTANIFMSWYEDASQANTEKLDVSVHQVASGSEAPAAGNLLASFTQIVGSNTTAAEYKQQIALNIDALDLTSKPYLQILMTETNTPEGNIYVGMAAAAKIGPTN